MQANQTTIALNWHKWNHFLMKWACHSVSEFLLLFIADKTWYDFLVFHVPLFHSPSVGLFLNCMNLLPLLGASLIHKSEVRVSTGSSKSCASDFSQHGPKTVRMSVLPYGARFSPLLAGSPCVAHKAALIKCQSERVEFCRRGLARLSPARTGRSRLLAKFCLVNPGTPGQWQEGGSSPCSRRSNVRVWLWGTRASQPCRVRSPAPPCCAVCTREEG